ncbi:MAG: hypothetical protein ACKV2T_35835 [Kofleriaceae bacterium]
MTGHYLGLCLALVACGDGSPAIDAGADAPAIDAPPPHPIVGRWERSNFSGGTTPVVFEANGIYRDGSSVGTWSIEGERLKLQDGTARFWLSEDANTLMTIAMFPTTPTSGVLGTWVGSYTFSDGVHQDTTMIFRGDGTLTWTDVRPKNTRSDEGTWQLEDDKIRIQATLGGVSPVNVAARLIPDVVIGEGLHTRVGQ